MVDPDSIEVDGASPLKPAITRKRCQRCLMEKPAAAFHRHSRLADGLQTWCKRCQAIQARLVSAAAAIEKAAARQREVQARQVHGKACCCCSRVLPLKEFGVDSRKPDGRRARCRACSEGPRRAAWARYRENHQPTPAALGAILALEGDGG